MHSLRHEIHPTVYTQEIALTYKASFSSSEIEGMLDIFLSELTCSIQSYGCKFFGHIKGLCDAGVRGCLFFSITSFGKKARYKGRFSDEIKSIKLVINIIVYGVKKSSIGRAVNKGITILVDKGSKL